MRKNSLENVSVLCTTSDAHKNGQGKYQVSLRFKDKETALLVGQQLSIDDFLLKIGIHPKEFFFLKDTTLFIGTISEKLESEVLSQILIEVRFQLQSL